MLFNYSLLSHACILDNTTCCSLLLFKGNQTFKKTKHIYHFGNSIYFVLFFFSIGGLQGQGAEVLISLDALVHEVDIGCQDREADSLASPQAP